MNETMAKCPSCEGAKRVRALVNYGRPKGCVWEMVDCLTCRGSGEVSADYAERAAAAAAVRRARLDAGLSMKQAADARGMTLREYNELEHARGEGVL